MCRVIGVIFILWISIVSAFAFEPDFGKFDGTAVIIDLNSSAITVYGNHADERVTPCSTFKILNTMIALDSGVVRDENETIVWDGVVREYPSWNRDHTMRSAIQVSAIWSYQELARRIGEKRMAEMVRKANYGNMDTSKTLTNFWLDGSLKISPNEQVDFLSKLVRDQLPFSLHSQSVVKDIMTLEKKDNYLLAGKTGSDFINIGWFVGFIERDDTVKVFAFQIRGEGANGAEAKKIAIQFLK